MQACNSVWWMSSVDLMLGRWSLYPFDPPSDNYMLVVHTESEWCAFTCFQAEALPACEEWPTCVNWVYKTPTFTHFIKFDFWLPSIGAVSIAGGNLFPRWWRFRCCWSWMTILRITYSFLPHTCHVLLWVRSSIPKGEKGVELVFHKISCQFFLLGFFAYLPPYGMLC